MAICQKSRLITLNTVIFIQGLSKPTRLAYIIDDSQILMAFAMFDRAKETGYGKFTDVALDFRNLIDFIITKIPPDVIVYLLHHVERSDDGRLKAKTAGKMLDNQLTVEGLFSIVLLCQTDGTNYKFYQNRWIHHGQSPLWTCSLPIDKIYVRNNRNIGEQPPPITKPNKEIKK